MAIRRPQFKRTSARNSMQSQQRNEKESFKPRKKTTSKRKPSSLSQVKELSQRSVIIGPSRGRHASINLGLIVVIAAAMIIFIAPPGYTLLNTYHEAHIVEQQLDNEKQRNSELKEELAKWEDSDFIETQARSRLGYVKPGQTRYQVVDPGQKYIEQRKKALTQEPEQPWFIQLQESIKVAGDPDDNHKIAPRKGVPFDGISEVSKKK